MGSPGGPALLRNKKERNLATVSLFVNSAANNASRRHEIALRKTVGILGT